MVYLLDEQIWFPNPAEAEDDGLLAVGGELSPRRLLLAYSHGIFPWSDFRKRQLHWYCPHERFVIFPNEVHVSHSMRTLINKGTYRTTMGEAFDEVIHHCSRLRIHQNGAWLGPDMVDAYTLLHELGFADSVEVWNGGKLVGGLYGVRLAGCFFGESMFSLEPSASKLALIHLARTMAENHEKMIDCQFHTPHLESMGGRFISYDDYMMILNRD